MAVYSAKNAWSEIDGAFNYREFYNNIIDLIKDSPDPEWKEELLKAWNVKLFKNEEGRDGNNVEESQKTTLCEGRDNDLARVHTQMAARCAAKAIPTPVLFTHEPTPAPSTHELTPPPPACEPSPVPSARKPSPTPPAPKPKPKLTAPAREPTLVPPAGELGHLTLPARAKSHAPSELTESDLNEDPEPVQIVPKGRAKK
ncbi:hypothetical protein BDR03DRAFT_1018347, partial [Suillus americanus]